MTSVEDPSRLSASLEDALGAGGGPSSGARATLELEPDVIVDSRYRIKERLNSGKSGDVYLAIDQKFNREIALKFFNADTTSTDTVITEGRALAKLDHPNLVRVHNAGEWRGTLYLELEYVNGKPLPGDRLSNQSAIDLGIQLADALAHAHEHGVVHLDVSAKNLLLDSHRRLKVVDFGMSRIAALVEQGKAIRAGTLGYMAPEQWAYRPCQKSDVFAAGVVIYRLSTGKLPLTVEALHLEPPREIDWSPVPTPLRSVLQRALAWSPEDRCDASTLAASLRAVRDRWRRRRRRGIAAVTILAIVIAAFGLWRTQELARQRRIDEERRLAAENAAALQLGFERLKDGDPRIAAAAFARALGARDPQVDLRARVGVALALEHLPRTMITVSRSAAKVWDLEASERYIAAMTEPEGIVRIDLRIGARDVFKLSPPLVPCRGVGVAGDGAIFFGLIPTRKAPPGGIGFNFGDCILHRTPPGATDPEEVIGLPKTHYKARSGPVPLAIDGSGSRVALWAPDGAVHVYRPVHPDATSLSRELVIERRLVTGLEEELQAVRLEFLDRDHLVAEFERKPDDSEVVLWMGNTPQPKCSLKHARFIGRVGQDLLIQEAGHEQTRLYDRACREAGQAPFTLARKALTLADAFVVFAADEILYSHLNGSPRPYFAYLPPHITTAAAPPSGKFLVFGTSEGEIGIATFTPFERATTVHFTIAEVSAPRWLAFSESGDRLAIHSGGVVDSLGAQLKPRSLLPIHSGSYFQGRLVGLDPGGHLVEEDTDGTLRPGDGPFDGIATCGNRLALVRDKQLGLGRSSAEAKASVKAGAQLPARAVMTDASCSIVLVVHESGLLSVFRDGQFIERRLGVDAAAVSPRGDLWIEAVGSEILARSARSQAELWRGRAHLSTVTVAAVDRQATLIATGDSQGCIVIWTMDGAPAAKICPPGAGISALAFSPDGERLVIAGAEGNVWIHDLRPVRIANTALDDLRWRARCASGRELVDGQVRDLPLDRVVSCLP